MNLLDFNSAAGSMGPPGPRLAPLKIPPPYAFQPAFPSLSAASATFSPRSADVLDALIGLSEGFPQRRPLDPTQLPSYSSPRSPTVSPEPSRSLLGPFTSRTTRSVVGGRAVESQPKIRGPWQREEDELLRELVTAQGPTHWSRISAQIPGRSGKQCRDRWINHLAPDIRKDKWSADEDAILLRAQAEVGNSWSKIAALLPGRPDTAVKNRWYGSLRYQRDSKRMTVA